jgi:hypothetical protein
MFATAYVAHCDRIHGVHCSTAFVLTRLRLFLHESHVYGSSRKNVISSRVSFGIFSYSITL